MTPTRHPLDEQFPEWGDGPYFTVELAATVPAADLLTHLYVLVPVLDDEKHYWVGDDEVEKLLRHGEGWLADAPGARADRPPLPASTAAASCASALARLLATTTTGPGRGRRRSRRRRGERRRSDA